MRTLFVFRQDLRLEDNRALIYALENSESVLPIFILDDESREAFGEDDRRFAFLREVLTSLRDQIQQKGGELRIHRGNPWEIIPSLCESEDIGRVIAGRSYAPHGKKRDNQTNEALSKMGIEMEFIKDFLLVEPWEVATRKVFSPFFKLWQKVLSDTTPQVFPLDPKWGSWIHHVQSEVSVEHIHPQERHPYYTLEYLDNRLKNYRFRYYQELRDFPAIDGASRFAPYLRFGVVSPRLLYTIAHEESPHFIQELAWREFWHHIAYHFPETYEREFLEKRRSIPWENDSYLQQKIENAETGYPLIDAAILQLKTTNYMHNRLRMVVASFITKNCLIDWRWGEAFFARYLLDYDSAVNTGNWQWAASVGADPKPLRIFNPLLQSEKFDSEAKFIKKYISELSEVSPKDIHSLNLTNRYHRPIVEQKASSQRAKEAYRESSQITGQNHGDE